MYCTWPLSRHTTDKHYLTQICHVPDLRHLNHIERSMNRHLADNTFLSLFAENSQKLPVQRCSKQGRRREFTGLQHTLLARVCLSAYLVQILCVYELNWSLCPNCSDSPDTVTPDFPGISVAVEEGGQGSRS